MESTPADKFHKELSSIIGDDGQQVYTGIEVIHLDAAVWVEMSRPRILAAAPLTWPSKFSVLWSALIWDGTVDVLRGLRVLVNKFSFQDCNCRAAWWTNSVEGVSLGI